MIIWPADIENRGNSYVSGVVVQVPSGRLLQVAWVTASEIVPTLEAAQHYAAVLLDRLIQAGMADDVDRTNWASVAAAIQKILEDFNARIATDPPSAIH
jgi:hypothetical protein